MLSPHERARLLNLLATNLDEANEFTTASRRLLLLTLTITCSLGQVASTIYVPSVPAIASALETSVSRVQLTFVAYLAAHTVPAGANYLVVFRVVGTAAFLAYGLGHVSDGIWKGQTWSMTIKEVLDGLVYGLLTAGTFGWLWPR